MFWTKQRDVGRRRLLRELREACPEGTRSYAIVDGLRVQDAKVWLDDDEARARFDAEHLAALVDRLRVLDRDDADLAVLAERVHARVTDGLPPGPQTTGAIRALLAMTTTRLAYGHTLSGDLGNPGMGQVLTRMGQVFAAAAVRLADEQATP